MGIGVNKRQRGSPIHIANIFWYVFWILLRNMLEYSRKVFKIKQIRKLSLQPSKAARAALKIAGGRDIILALSSSI